jgi:hypothetical protein
MLCHTALGKLSLVLTLLANLPIDENPKAVAEPILIAQ